MTTVGIGTFRPSTGRWYLDLNGNGQLDSGTTDARLGPFGTATDKPVVGNWAGNGVTRTGYSHRARATGNWTSMAMVRSTIARRIAVVVHSGPLATCL
jgi:hypothetical protein